MAAKAGEEKKEGPHEDAWESLLKKHAQKKTEEQSTKLLVFGDRKNGKSEMLKKFSNRVGASKNSRDYLVDFSYIKVVAQSDDELRGYMSIWEVDNAEQALDLLPQFVQGSELKNTAYVITLDLSQPWSLMASLKKWVNILEKFHKEKLKLSEKDQRELLGRISRHNQTFGLEEKKDTQSGTTGDSTSTTASTSSGTTAPVVGITINEQIPKCNLGVPLIIVGCKADLLGQIFTQLPPADYFEYITRCLRRFCLDYGASLFFISAKGSGTNIDILQEYVNYRLYNFTLIHKPKVVGSESEFPIFIPSGYDSETNISSIHPAKRVEDTQQFEDVFKKPASQGKLEKKDEDELKADDNNIFFKSLKLEIDNKRSDTRQPRVEQASQQSPPIVQPAIVSPRGRSRNSISIPAANTNPQDTTVVKDFFRSLLNKNPQSTQDRTKIKQMLRPSDTN